MIRSILHQIVFSCHASQHSSFSSLLFDVHLLGKLNDERIVKTDLLKLRKFIHAPAAIDVN